MTLLPIIHIFEAIEMLTSVCWHGVRFRHELIAQLEAFSSILFICVEAQQDRFRIGTRDGRSRYIFTAERVHQSVVGGLYVACKSTKPRQQIVFLGHEAFEDLPVLHTGDVGKDFNDIEKVLRCRGGKR